jgi:hypothetical protein
MGRLPSVHEAWVPSPALDQKENQYRIREQNREKSKIQSWFFRMDQ